MTLYFLKSLLILYYVLKLETLFSFEGDTSMNRNLFPYFLKGILMAILIFVAEYLSFVLIANKILRLLLVLLIIVVSSHLLLEITLRYKSVLMFSCILVILFGILSYIGMKNETIGSFEYSKICWYTVALNWLVPYIYCFIRQYLDRGPRFPDYNKFFIGMTVFFFIPFTFIFIYLNYVNPDFFSIYYPKGYEFIPFYTTATYIENILNGTIHFSNFFVYTGLYVLMYLPIGYHGRLLTRNYSLIIRVVLFLLVGIIAEAIKIPVLGNFNIDNILFSMLGVLIGCGLFAFVDYQHYKKKDAEYLHRSSFNFTYRY